MDDVMRLDVRVCIGAFALGYAYISRDFNGAIFFHENKPTLNEAALKFFSRGNAVYIDKLSCHDPSMLHSYFKHFPKGYSCSIQEYVRENGDVNNG